MLRLRLIIPLAAGLALAAGAAPRALALAQTQSATGNPPSPTYKVTQKVANLSPITVRGHYLPLPVELQVIKKALTRSWSSSKKDRNKLVCRWGSPLGTHLQYLYCQTNREHSRIVTQTRLGLTNAAAEEENLYAALVNGQVPTQVSYWGGGKRIPRSTMAPLLRKLPPANASYTFRITGNNGKPVLDYVIKNGNLVHIYHYVYKKGNGQAKQ